MKKILLLSLSVLIVIAPLEPCSAEVVIPAGKLLSLEESLDRALKDDVQVKRAEARLEKEEALLRAVKHEAFPKLTTDAYTAVTSGDSHGVVFWTSEIRLPLFEGGRRIHEKKKRDLEVQEERLHIEEARQDVAYQVKAIYIGLLKEKELTRLSQEWEKESEKLFFAMKDLHAKELITREELYRWEALHKTAEQELLKHKEAMDYGEALVRELAVVGEDERIVLAPLGELSPEDSNFQKMIEDIRKQNPLYEIANLRVKEKEEEKKVLRSERFPKISLSNRFNIARDTYIDQNRFELGVVGSWNIWDFGVLGNELAAKDAEIKEAREDGHLQTRALEHETRKLISDLKVAWGKTETVKSLLQEKKEIYKNEKVRVLQSQKGKAEIFETFVTLTQVQMSFVEAMAEYRLLKAQLEKIISAEIST